MLMILKIKEKYLCFQFDSFPLLEETIEGNFQLSKTGCIQSLKSY